ncbi:MAG: hypothetical protein A3F18_07310 [Legionellales bacterium RIFCSPHIGHO2_12_FULL_37_14]|nr:MAG: hypothetical protein A3F18_07310 [Legionellales bacterium RIFCSPHIGHO2_12_FULL_37_14]
MLTENNLYCSTFDSQSLSCFAWTSEEGALSDKLKQLYGECNLTLLTQKWTLPNWWEKQFLHLQETILRRDIIMGAQGNPYWFARTMLPLTTYKKDVAFFNRLKKEPLMNLVFNEPKVKREILWSYGINRQNLEFHWLQKAWINEDTKLFARFSLFSLMSVKRFYLLEIFLKD